MTTVELSFERRTVLLHGVGVILVASVLFGAMAVCVRLAARDMAASQIAFVRFCGSLLVLLALTRGRGLRPQSGNLPRVLLRGLLGAGAIVLYYQGIQGAGAGLATLLNCTYPVFTAVFASSFMGERFDARIGAALIVNLIGVLVVLAPGAHMGPAAMSGGISALAAAVLAGGAVATARELRASESALLVTTYFMAVGAVVTAPTRRAGVGGPFKRPGGCPPISGRGGGGPPPTLLLGLPAVSTGLVCALSAVVLTSLGGQVLLHQGLGFAPATQGSLAAATSVVTAAVLEAACLGEHLSGHSLLGACCLIVAVGLAASRR